MKNLSHRKSKGLLGSGEQGFEPRQSGSRVLLLTIEWTASGSWAAPSRVPRAHSWRSVLHPPAERSKSWVGEGQQCLPLRVVFSPGQVTSMGRSLRSPAGPQDPPALVRACCVSNLAHCGSRPRRLDTPIQPGARWVSCRLCSLLARQLGPTRSSLGGCWRPPLPLLAYFPPSPTLMSAPGPDLLGLHQQAPLASGLCWAQPAGVT